MAKLKFLDELNEQQLEYAAKIAEKAKALGVPPNLAIAIAYQESRLNPNIKNGTKGEIGGMQVMPATGKEFGYDAKALTDPDSNADAGLKYLKKSLDTHDGDHKLATVGYNAGINAPFFTGGTLPESTKKYVQDMQSYNAYEPPESEGASDDGKNDLVSAPNVPPSPTERKPDLSNASPSDRLLFGGLGAGVGILGSGAKGFLDNREANINNRAYTQELARLRAQKEMGMLPPAAPAAPVTSSILTPSQVAPKQPVPMGVADAGRIPSSQTGSNPYNYAKSLGVTDIEAGRALDMTKEAGGAHDIANQRRVALNALQGSGFAENPNFGGLMTQQPSAGGGPRQSFTFQPEGGLSSLPPSQPVSMAPKAIPPLSGLDKVNQVFERMMQLSNPLGSAFNTVVRRALPPIAAASGGLDLAELLHEYQKPEIDRDMAKIITKGGALGSAAVALKKPMIGVPAALGFTGADMIRERYFGPNKSVMDPLTTQPPAIPRVQPQDIMQDALQQQRNQQMLGLGM